MGAAKTPLTASQLKDAFEAEGCDPQEYENWQDHERDDETGKPFGPVNGIAIHHTAGANSLALVYSGTSSLPGPLCHVHLSKTAVFSLISAGRANHAGTFAQNAHDAVVTQSTTHPAPASAEPVDGNDKYYGIEIENLGNGTDPYPWVQYVKAVKFATALCRAHGWTCHSVIGHKEGTTRKIDPKGPVVGPTGVRFDFTMIQFRVDVRSALALPAGVWATQEEDVALTDAEKNDIAELAAQKVWGHLLTNPFRLDAEGNPRKVAASAFQVSEDGHYDQVAARLGTLQAMLTDISVAGVDLDALAVKVADEIYKRMAQ